MADSSITSTGTRPQIQKFVPAATPETLPFWEGTARKELWIQRCEACAAAIFYPRVACPECSSTELTWVQASGRATLYSYTIVARPTPGWEADAPYVIAVVELAEGPRMMTNIIGVAPDPAQLPLDCPLIVDFQDRGGMTLPVFRLAPEES